MFYGFMYSYLFSIIIFTFSLTEANVGGTGKVQKTGEIAMKIFQLVHNFNKKFKDAVLPLKYNSTNAALKCTGETGAIEECEGIACGLLSDFRWYTSHTSVAFPAEIKNSPLGRSIITNIQADLFLQHLHDEAKEHSNCQKCKLQINQGCMFSHVRKLDC